MIPEVTALAEPHSPQNKKSRPRKSGFLNSIGGGGPRHHLATFLKNPTQHVLRIGKRELKEIYMAG
jgi:hypothetical protein